LTTSNFVSGLNDAAHPVRRALPARFALPCAIDYALSELLTSSDHDWVSAATPENNSSGISLIKSGKSILCSVNMDMTFFGKDTVK
jgi:hypothetical protein